MFQVYCNYCRKIPCDCPQAITTSSATTDIITTGQTIMEAYSELQSKHDSLLSMTEKLVEACYELNSYYDIGHSSSKESTEFCKALTDFAKWKKENLK